MSARPTHTSEASLHTKTCASRRLAAYAGASIAFVAAYVPSIIGNDSANQYFNEHLPKTTMNEVHLLSFISICVACSLQLCARLPPSPPAPLPTPAARCAAPWRRAPHAHACSRSGGGRSDCAEELCVNGGVTPALRGGAPMP